jgi:enoyl-CoA hydratase
VILAGGAPGRFIAHFSPEEILAGVRDARRELDRGPVHNSAVNRALNALAELRMPAIAALNGDAMGFGFELALACDLRVGEKGD